METHVTYLVRVWLPDRPGALGLVASRFGALKGDVMGLEIIERGGGLAIDELVISLPATVSVDLIVREISSVDGVKVEDVRPMSQSIYDPQLEVLEAAAIILGAETREDLATALVEHVRRVVRASWACIVESGGVLAASGDCPNDRWLNSFISGSPIAVLKGGGTAPAMDAVWLRWPGSPMPGFVG